MLLNPWNPTARFSFAGLAACLMVVGACTTETITEVEVGKQVTMNLEPALMPEVTLDHRLVHVLVHEVAHEIVQEAVKELLHFHYDFRYEEVSKLVTAQPGVEDASVSVSVGQEGEGEVNLHILAFGSGLDGENLVNAITDSYPSLSQAAVTINKLHTTFSESLASKIGRTLFHLEGNRPDPLELRQQALEELAARG